MGKKLTGINYGIRPAHKYVDWFNVGVSCPHAVIAMDQAKFNLAYLAFPEIEKGGTAALPKDFVEEVHTLIDAETYRQLLRLPLTFMGHWQKLHHKMGDVPLAEILPDHYMGTMLARSHMIQARLVEKNGNVMKVAFWRTT